MRIYDIIHETHTCKDSVKNMKCTPSQQSCIWQSIASMWVDFYHAAFVSRSALERENEQIRISLIQKELSSCQKQLGSRESELQERILFMERDALAKKRSRDLPGAKKRLMEKRRVQAQLEKLQNSMATIDLHRNTIEVSVLDRTVLETLRASGDALKQMGATSGGIRAVEEIVADVESQMESAAEIARIISTGSVSGMVNTMAWDGIVMDDEELMKELDALDTEMEDMPMNESDVHLAVHSMHQHSLANVPIKGTKISTSSSRNRKYTESAAEATADCNEGEAVAF
jgi:hypothetical protein